MDQIEAFILAGGASSRMGTDKARLFLEGKTFIERISQTLGDFASRVVIVGQHSEDLSLESVSDIHPKWGALGGIETALTNCETEWAFVIACDLPFATADLCRRLSNFRQSHDAVVPIQQDLIPQPLCALYQVAPCLVQVTKLIETGLRRPLDLLQSVNTKWVPFAEIEDLSGSENFFVNINT
ncbi:MAG TPA: molybdenum cofactor guanylyltransferase, partial [Pyrinomonadaceae bacterium]|nr:molybdenum cofactor guanylyltransferase [Pyrinomonadaceae bacterium]